MAKSRLVSQEIAEDSKIARCSDEAALTYAFTIPFLDRDGLCSGKPSWIAGRALQERPHLQHMVGKYIGEWVAQGLVIRYEGNDGPVLFFPGFRKHNANLPYEREAVSKFPPPPGYHRGKVGLIPNDPELAGRLAQSFDARSLYAIALTEAATDETTLEASLGLNTGSHNKVVTYSRPSHDEVVSRSRGIEVEVKDQVEVKEEKNERMNEYARGDEEQSFIHSLPLAQPEFKESLELLTDPEVGLDEKGARDLAAKVSFELLERHVFAWLAERKNGGSFSMTGALIHRIKSKFSAPDLTAEQKRSALYGRFHTDAGGGYSMYNHLLRRPDQDEAAS